MAKDAAEKLEPTSARNESGERARPPDPPPQTDAPTEARRTFWDDGLRIIAMLVGLGVMGVFIFKADPGPDARFVDRLFLWSFVVFAVGLAELFLLFVGLAIWGRIDLAKAFEDKLPEQAAQPKARGAERAQPASVSLSRLQAFLWTLVVMIIYFYKVATSADGEFPTLPPELLMVMGISSAVYLTSKHMVTRSRETPQAPPGEGGSHD